MWKPFFFGGGGRGGASAWNFELGFELGFELDSLFCFRTPGKVVAVCDLNEVPYFVFGGNLSAGNMVAVLGRGGGVRGDRDKLVECTLRHGSEQCIVWSGVR